MIVRILFLAVVFLAHSAFAEKIPAFQDRKEWFLAFLRNTDQKEQQKKGTLEILQTLYPHVWERIQDRNYPFVSLFVGAGSGGVEIPLIEEFKKERGGDFSVFCEDVSFQMKEEFFANAGPIQKQIEEYSLLPFEDENYLPPQADFAIASHVWYFIKNWKGVENEKNSLVKFAALTGDREGGGLITLQSKKGDRYHFNSLCASLVGKQKELVAEEVAAELDRLGIDYRIFEIESRVNVSSCFKEGKFDPKEEGKCLLSFLTFEYWDNLSSDVKERISQEFLSKIKIYGKEEIVFRDLQICIGSFTSS
jgi:hypothetical protein